MVDYLLDALECELLLVQEEESLIRSNYSLFDLYLSLKYGPAYDYEVSTLLWKFDFEIH